MKKRGLEDLRVWMDSVEAERLEFKEAKSNFDFEKLVRYCIALANEGGGVLVLGVTDKRPRKVVGTRAFEDLERTKGQLVDRLRPACGCGRDRAPGWQGRRLQDPGPPARSPAPLRRRLPDARGRVSRRDDR